MLNFLAKNKYFIILVALIIVLRIALIKVESFKIDMGDYQAWAAKIAESGPANFYSAGYFTDYFPGYLYILWILSSVIRFFSPSFSLFSSDFAFIIKAVTNIFDLSTAFLIYQIVRKKDDSWGRLSLILYLLNPAIIFNSSIWGQVDGVMAFFVVLASYLIIETRKVYLGIILFAFGILVKPQSILISPILLLNIFNKSKIQAFVSLILLGIFIILFSFPFFTGSPIFGLVDLFKSSTSLYPYTSLYAFNFWAIIGFWQKDNLTFILPYQTLGLILFLLSLIPIFYLSLKNSSNKLYLYLASSLIFLSFFLFPTRIHERYLFPFFGLFLIYASLKKSLTHIIIYLLISLVHLANLFYVYYYYNIIYNHPEIKPNFFYNFINHSYLYLSLFTIFCFGLILFKAFNFKFKEIK